MSYLQRSGRMVYYKKILEYNNWGSKNLKKLQDEKLRRLLLHAYNNVPYYREILSKAGVVLKDRVILKNFSKIPVLTKDLIRENFENLKSSDIDRRHGYLNHSGGSTGQPVNFMQDPEMEDWNIANKFLYRTYVGQELGELEMRLWGSERDFLGEKETFIKRLKYFFFNRIDLNAFKMSEEKMKEYLNLINIRKPTWIEAYVQPIYELTLFAKRNNFKISYSPKGVLVSAGTLYPEMKKVIREYWGCEVLNRYGSREVGDMACGFDRLKVSPWNHLLEIINRDKTGLGKVLVTTLNNYSMPLIRYDIGDIARQGKDWLFLEEVQGREMSVIRTKDGKIIPGEFLIHFLGVVMNDGSIKKFQVVQQSYKNLDIKVVLNDKLGFGKEKENIEKLIEKAMGYKCNIKWIYVKDIKPLNSGKYLYIKSNVK
ncbi:MAG: hypothetical protein PHE21_01230 [Candidatus Dojkabacteria bacterium]|nr:hypothetical protein [Candidatus Dojkabacteria bacterium]